MESMIKNSDLQVILSWIRSRDVFLKQAGEEEQYDMKWNLLLVQIMFDKNGETKVEDIVEFDKMILIASEIYKQFEKIDLREIFNSDLAMEEIKKVIPEDKLYDIDELIKEEQEKMLEFENIINNIFINFTFEDEKLKTEKRKYLQNILNSYIRQEDYEKCIPIQNALDKI